MNNVIDIGPYKGHDPINVFDHRRTRSTVAMTTKKHLFNFEVRRAEAVALQARLTDRPCQRARVLAEFIERWRQQ